ncbi:NAD(P)/FAD-dependent oxidoreductase [Flavobacterium pallidum]|uniref:FAD-dependent oxidoreductase n=1 Tax=Flavobacterium pallidum TaxID=2172098 RepID=A0A2S1SDZ3_9FLAO|nr:FAD-dependent oxidoreductase [Flavobacterium pallidum]AWI24601.1 FAD-dependent oxidoreductase [Flavobacterium pallidum]
MVDYLIVGCGLAGIAFAETAIEKGKSVIVYDNDSQNSSKVAGGLFNPVILKRYSRLQDAMEQVKLLQVFYCSIENKLCVKDKIVFDLPVLRKFFSIEEQNNWFMASDKPGLTEFLSTTLFTKSFNGIQSPFDYGQVLHTGYVDTQMLIAVYRDYLNDINSIRFETFDYGSLSINYDRISYHNLEAKHIVFAEGFGIHSNPYFNYLPLDGTKGELLIIKAPDLELDVILNTNVFILPLGNNLFKVGATYNWDDKTPIPTPAGREELIQRTKEILQCDFEIIEHLAGIRPTVRDRKPLLGTHPDYPRMHILNGLGTRGVMLGPFMAQKLFDHIENQILLEPSISIKRFAPA